MSRKELTVIQWSHYRSKCKAMAEIIIRKMRILLLIIIRKIIMVLMITVVMVVPGRVLPYSLGGGVPLGSRKSYPLLDQIFQIL